MSHRSRASKVRQHVHCESCYSRRCRARVQVSVSCSITTCRLHCGALFHLCKEEDHLLLCPNVRVPCLNAGYGCPVQMPRSSRAAHLRVCPASVVCCSMDWLRWPTDETHPHSNIALQEKVLKENDGQEKALDLATALVDQSDLFSRLKMRPLYPELMDKEEEAEEEKKKEEKKKEEIAVGGFVSDIPNNGANEAENSSYTNPSEETVQPDVSQKAVIDKDKYNLFEMMFSMERGACEVAQQNLNNPKQDEKAGEKDGRDSKERPVTETNAGEDGEHCPQPDTSKTGHAPWQEGVMDRLKEDLTPQEYNMYIVHHGRMLVTFGQIAACTPREKDFVYGSLEPIPVQTLCSFKIPDSYHYRQRAHLYDATAKAQSETRSVDTSDLGASEEDWFSDEATTTLLGYAEEEVMGHKISESKAIDGLYIDIGTQTHTFHSAPFKRKTTLAEVTADKPVKLHLQLQAESVNSRHSRATCVFTFLCGHTFHRREFATHFRNVHSEIQTCLSGWFEQRCPLSYLGCTYSQRRFRPSTHNATVTHDQQLRTFNLRPTLVASSGNDSQAAGGGGGRGKDNLGSLPYEVLCHMASFLDSLSLSQLALVSRLMRQVCSSLLQDRGMVTLRWERKTESCGGAKWTAKPVWEFSRLFSSVDSWQMADAPPISAHLKVCPYYETQVHSEPVPLPSMSDKQRCSQERMSLVNLFKSNR